MRLNQMLRFSFILATLVSRFVLAATLEPPQPLANPTATPVRPSVKAQIDKDELLGHIQYLASPELRGREAGTVDQLKAAAYIASEFKRYGLEPFGDAKTFPKSGVDAELQDLSGYFQFFQMTAAKGAGQNSHLSLKSGNNEKAFALRKDFAPFPAGVAHAAAKGGIVFAGYGIMAPEIPYDDFNNVDLTGKWALILRYQPQESDPKSKFGGKNYTRHAGLASKIYNCVMRHATGVLIVTGPGGHENEPEKLTDGAGALLGEFTIPVFQITRRTADAILAPAGKSVAALQKDIDRDLSVQSFVIKDVQLDGESEILLDDRNTANILARIEGRDEKLKKEYVVIGAHSDHVGLGFENSVLGKEGRGKLHPGADDNASGTAGLLEIAQYFGSLKPEERPRRSILFMSFSGEEEGLIGSNFYLKHPNIALSDIAAMINLDMIGRSVDGSVEVAGIGTSKGFKDIIEHSIEGLPVKLHLGSSGVGPSDHAAFCEHRIPVLFFTTGLHPDYHRPTDTWDKINAPVAQEVAELAAKISGALADSPKKPDFRDAGPVAFLGVTPDNTRSQVSGYPVGHVARNSPADDAGIKTGDVIFEFNGQPLTLPMDLPMNLIDFSAGDEVELALMRKENRINVKVKLSERKNSNHGG